MDLLFYLFGLQAVQIGYLLLLKHAAVVLVMARDQKCKTHFVNIYVHLHMPVPSTTAIWGGGG